MFKRRTLFLCLLLSFNCLFILAQEQSMPYRSILNFEDRSAQWRMQSNAFLLQIDQHIVKDEKHPIKISYNKRKSSLSVSPEMIITTALSLPELSDDSLNVTLSYKGSELKKCLFVIRGFDDSGKVINIDTINFADQKDWAIGRMNFKKHSITTLELAFKISSTENLKDFAMWLDRIQITANGKALDEYPKRKVDLGIKKRAVVKLSLNDDRKYKQISELETEKIFGLGESIHGSENVSDAVFDIMKHRILYNNCKLVLFEFPLDEMLSFNRYMRGDNRFELDSIVQNSSFNLSVISAKAIDFFKWVRQYNETAKKKVSVLGFDIPIGDADILYAANLFDYLKTLKSSNFKTTDVARLAQITFASENLMADLKKLGDEAKVKYDDVDLDLINNYHQILLSHSSSDPSLVRDSCMFQNINYLINRLCSPAETVTIYSHLIHLCYDRSQTEGGLFVSPSCGNLLKKKFGNDYFCTGIFVGSGQNRIFNVTFPMSDIGFISNTLRLSHEKSLEFQLKQLKKDYFYMPIGSMQSVQSFIRFGDSSCKDYFLMAYPSSLMEGVLYLNESTPSTIIMQDMPFQQKILRRSKRMSSFLNFQSNISPDSRTN